LVAIFALPTSGWLAAQVKDRCQKATAKQKKPSIVKQPASLEQLSNIVALHNEVVLDCDSFAIATKKLLLLKAKTKLLRQNLSSNRSNSLLCT
jgi:hypothetical protein